MGADRGPHGAVVGPHAEEVRDPKINNAVVHGASPIPDRPGGGEVRQGEVALQEQADPGGVGPTGEGGEPQRHTHDVDLGKQCISFH